MHKPCQLMPAHEGLTEQVKPHGPPSVVSRRYFHGFRCGSIWYHPREDWWGPM